MLFGVCGSSRHAYVPVNLNINGPTLKLTSIRRTPTSSLFHRVIFGLEIEIILVHQG